MRGAQRGHGASLSSVGERCTLLCPARISSSEGQQRTTQTTFQIGSQECLLYWLTSWLTMRPLPVRGPTIVHRKGLRRGAAGAATRLSQAPQTDGRSREYLTAAEGTRLRKAARSVGRHRLRNATMSLLAYRHGLRVSELMRWRGDQLDLDQGLLPVRRVKHGVPSTHPLTESEIRALRTRKRLAGESADVFRSERTGPLTDANVRKMIARARRSRRAGLPRAPPSAPAWVRL
jgi:integrase